MRIKVIHKPKIKIPKSNRCLPFSWKCLSLECISFVFISINFSPKIFYVDQCVVKDMIDSFDVVASGYFDEFCHMCIVGNNLSSNRNKCVDMVANVNDTSMLWNQCVHPTKYGSL